MEAYTAFEDFFRNNFERLNLYALHIINDGEISRDIVADAMEYAWRNFPERNTVQWYKYSLAFIRNKCLDHIRRKAIHQRYADFFRNVMEHKDTADYMEDERLQDIMKVIDTLKPKTRLVLQECYINHKTYKDVAEELEISTNGVKKHIVAALRTIREEMAKKYKKR